MENILKKTIMTIACAMLCGSIQAQLDESGINAGFFDSGDPGIPNLSKFHLPPLAVLFENAKQNPEILDLDMAQRLAQAEVSKQKRHIFSYVKGHASYSYGKTDMWGNNSSSYNQMIYQFQGSEQNYWNVGVDVSVPLEDILDLTAAVKRKRMEAESARIKKDIAFDKLKLQIATLYVKITNDLVTLKTASENAASLQGAGVLNKEKFHNGEISIKEYSDTKTMENEAVTVYQTLQTTIATDIITLEILTHPPIITNVTTDVTLDENEKMSEKDIARENKAMDKKIKKQAEEDEKELKRRAKEEEKKAKEEEKKAKDIKK